MGELNLKVFRNGIMSMIKAERLSRKRVGYKRSRNGGFPSGK